MPLPRLDPYPWQALSLKVLLGLKGLWASEYLESSTLQLLSIQ